MSEFLAVLEVQSQFWRRACLPTLCWNDGVLCMCSACVCARSCRCVCPYMYIYRVYIYTPAHLCRFSFSRQYCLFRFVFSLDHRFCLTNFCLCKTKQKYANIWHFMCNHKRLHPACSVQGYFSDAWNTFDSLIVIGSIVDVVLSEADVSIPQLTFPSPYFSFSVSPLFPSSGQVTDFDLMFLKFEYRPVLGQLCWYGK